MSGINARPTIHFQQTATATNESGVGRPFMANSKNIPHFPTTLLPMHYRRNYQQGGCYFFTLVSHQRRPILTHPDIRHALREAIEAVRQNAPFTILAWVLLPEHLHTLWQLPDNDANYSMRWNQIKRRTSHQCPHLAPIGNAVFGSTPFVMRRISPPISITSISIRSNTAM